MYNISKTTIFNSKMIDDDVVIVNSLCMTTEEVSNKIVSLANSLMDNASLIQHNTSRSIVYFENKRIEFSRI